MNITVLLADDHGVVRDGLRLLLEAQGDIEVVGEATNGHEAVDQVAKLRPDVVVMDIAMPGLSGIEATRRIREICPSTPVIVLSMHSTTEYVSRALQAGACGYLLKESVGMEVVQAVRTVHSGRPYLSYRISRADVDDYARRRQASGAMDPLTSLSRREGEVLQLVVEGRTSTEIAGILELSPKTIDTYRSRLMRKLGFRDIPSLVKFAIRNGVIPLE